MFNWICSFCKPKEPTRQERMRKQFDDSLMEAMDKMISSLTDDIIQYVHNNINKEKKEEKEDGNSS